MNSSEVQKNLARELTLLYRKWPVIRNYLKSIGCDNTSAEDIFQEALLIYSRKKEDPNFVLAVEPIFYVRNTCKLLWYNQARKENKHISVSIETDLAEKDQNDWLEKELKIRTIETVLTKLGEKCQDLLALFYGQGWSMEDIAKKIGLRSDKVAKAQKYRCLQKAKDLVQESMQESFNA